MQPIIAGVFFLEEIIHLGVIGRDVKITDVSGQGVIVGCNGERGGFKRIQETSLSVVLVYVRGINKHRPAGKRKIEHAA